MFVQIQFEDMYRQEGRQGSELVGRVWHVLGSSDVVREVLALQNKWVIVLAPGVLVVAKLGGNTDAEQNKAIRG